MAAEIVVFGFNIFAFFCPARRFFCFGYLLLRESIYIVDGLITA